MDGAWAGESDFQGEEKEKWDPIGPTHNPSRYAARVSNLKI